MPVYNTQDPESLIHALGALEKEAGVIIYPTDTTYGLGAKITNERAVQRVFAIKDRAGDKALSILVADLEMAQRYIVCDEMVERLAAAFLPGPLTIIADKRDTVPDYVTGGDACVGLRIPDNAFCLALARQLDTPYTTTSANRSGDRTPPLTLTTAKNSLGKMWDEIDCAIDGGELTGRTPSTLVKIDKGMWKILRPGPITEQDIQSVLG